MKRWRSIREERDRMIALSSLITEGTTEEKKAGGIQICTEQIVKVVGSNNSRKVKDLV